MRKTLAFVTCPEDAPVLHAASSAFLAGGEELHLVSLTKGAMPDGDFFGACAGLGLHPKCIHLYHHRGNAGRLTLDTAMSAMRFYLQMYPSARLVAPSPLRGLSQPRDQKACGLALAKLCKSGECADAVFAVNAGSEEQLRSLHPGVKVESGNPENPCREAVTFLRHEYAGEYCFALEEQALVFADEQAEKVRALEKRCKKAESGLSEAKGKYEKIKKSKSYKIGRIVTGVPRKLKKALKRGK